MSFVSEIIVHCFPLNRKPPADVIDGAEATGGDGPDEFLRGDVALAAVLLDAVGASPADFKHGVHVIHAPSALSEGVKRAIAKTSGIDFCDVRAYRRPTDALWVTGVFDESTIIAGLQAKASLIGVAASKSRPAIRFRCGRRPNLVDSVGGSPTYRIRDPVDDG